MQIVEDMLLLLTKLIFFFLPHESFASYDDCKLQNGKEIVLDVCVPDRYDKMSPPMEHPTIVQVDFRITGLKRVDLLSNTFSIYMSTYREWQDSRLQIKWNKNETLKYLPNKISGKIWLPWISNPHILGQDMAEGSIVLHREVTIELIFPL